MAKRKRIVVAGFMARCPISGVVWQHLHYIVGLQRLGHDVYYIEDSSRPLYDPVAESVDIDCSHAVALLHELAAAFGFAGRWGYCARFATPFHTAGLDYTRIHQLYREADAILNICGSMELHDDVLQNDRLIYVESDPGLEQIKIDQGNEETREYIGRHRALFTFGENIGTEEFPVPLHGFRWLPTRQPVVADWWRTDEAPPADAAFTSVVNWATGGQKDVTWRGRKYVWSKAEEFVRFIDAPRISAVPFELAAQSIDADTAAQFRDKGWRIVSPREISISPEAYRGYIRRSRGEFTVAKDQYVSLRTGWFSDRSACYLAAGRPVITQETGFSRVFGGNGLFGVSDPDGVREAAEAIGRDYEAHSRGARVLAQEVFGAERVLASLLERAGV